MGLYCTGKAARDMYFQVLAAENPQVRFLNWAPGPMLTGMTELLSESVFVDSTRNAFQGMKTENTFVDCHTSVEKLLKVLKDNEFTSGAHIDFYDV